MLETTKSLGSFYRDIKFTITDYLMERGVDEQRKDNGGLVGAPPQPDKSFLNSVLVFFQHGRSITTIFLHLTLFH